MPIRGRSCGRKGSGYERELAAYLNESLFGGRPRVARAPLSGGGAVNLSAGGSDLLGLAGLFVEAKRTERLDARGALRQAEENARLRETDDAPVVITRRNREATEDSLVLLRLKDFLRFYAAWLRAVGEP